MSNKKIQFDNLGATSRVNLDVNQYSDSFFGFNIVGSGDTSTT